MEINSSSRKEGYYWVKIKPMIEGRRWSVAYYYDSHLGWDLFNGTDMDDGIYDDALGEIGDYIPYPDSVS